jgi:hypothetical protein
MWGFPIDAFVASIDGGLEHRAIAEIDWLGFRIE